MHDTAVIAKRWTPGSAAHEKLSGMKNIERSSRVPHSPRRVVEILTTEEFWLGRRKTTTTEDGTSVAGAGPAKSVDYTMTGDIDSGISVRAVAAIDKSVVPAPLQPFVTKDLSLVQRIECPPVAPEARTAQATGTTEVQGAPVEADVDFDVVAIDDENSEVTIRARVTSSMPLVGGMVESAVAPFIEKVFASRLKKLAKA